MNLTVSRNGAGTSAISIMAYVMMAKTGTDRNIGFCFFMARKILAPTMMAMKISIICSLGRMPPFLFLEFCDYSMN